jgi:intein-encoded DNA endonuclease-like protein
MPAKITFAENQISIIIKCYMKEKMSLGEISRRSQELIGIKVCQELIKRILVKENISLRTISEQTCQLKNINETFLNEEMIEWVDGFLLGDGAINFKKERCFRYGKILGSKYAMRSVQKEWTDFAMSKFLIYGNCKTHLVDRRKDPHCPNVFWDSNTLSHPDINFQTLRWYGQNLDYIKQIPKDVRITPKSLLLWYLGDGNLYLYKNVYMIALCTDSFLKDDICEILIPKLKEIGIKASLSRDKKHYRIRIFGKSIAIFFNFIGRISPINCYSYKFNIPQDRFLPTISDLFLNKKDMAKAYYLLKTRNNYGLKCTRESKHWRLTPEVVEKIKAEILTQNNH